MPQEGRSDARGRASGFLDRLGGVFVRPRATLAGVLARGEGSLFEVLPWIALCAFTVAPIPAGQALLLLRARPVDGVLALAGVVTTRMGGALIGALVGALVLQLLGQLRPGGKVSLGFDRCLDACTYALLPHLALASVGAGLSELGLELWFMPHRLLRGTGFSVASRFVVAYGWSLVLFGGMMIWIWRSPIEEMRR